MDTCDLNSCEETKYMNEIGQLAKLLRQYRFPDADPLLSLTERNWPSSMKLTTGALYMICLIFAFLLLVVIGSSLTIYERFYKCPRSNDDKTRRKNSKPNDVLMNRRGSLSKDAASHSKVKPTSLSGCLECLKRFFKCFCLFTNGKSLLNTVPSAGNISCLNGIRFISQIFLMCAHMGTQIHVAASGSNKDEKHLLNAIADQFIISSAMNAATTFIFVSGFLNAFSFFQGALKNKTISWLYIYANRFIRITPLYMIVIGFYTTLIPYMGSGPFWSTYSSIQICNRHWIWNLLFLNNFRPQNEQCMAWSWFLSADMQFFIISPIFLVSLWRRPKIGYSLLGVFFCVSVLVNAILTFHFNLFSCMDCRIETLDDVHRLDAILDRFYEYFQTLHIKPYSRVGPYLIGVALAYYCIKRKQNSSGKNSLVTICWGWGITTGIMIVCSFGELLGIEESIFNVASNSLGGPLFSIALSWVLFMCVTGQGGFVNNLLSLKIFLPLSRLAYSVYLTHFIVFSGYFTTLKEPLDFSLTTTIPVIVYLIVASYAVAFAVTLIFEYPLSELQKLVFRVSKLK